MFRKIRDEEHNAAWLMFMSSFFRSGTNDIEGLLVVCWFVFGWVDVVSRIWCERCLGRRFLHKRECFDRKYENCMRNKPSLSTNRTEVHSID